MSFLRRLRACLDARAFPYERTVCVYAFVIRLAFILVPALTWWSATAWLPADFGLVGWAWRIHCAWGAGWLGGFVWADVLEERYREIFVGCPHNSNLFPICTLEGYVGQKRGGYPDDDRNEKIFHRSKWAVHLPWELSGQPRYDFTPEQQWTWAMRLHFALVRPRLRARGVPGY